MAVVMTDARLAGSRALLGRLRELKTSSRRADRGLVPAGQQVLLALEDETVRELMPRLRAYNPPVWLAVYYPVTERLVLAEVGLAERTPDSVAVGADTTVGMLLDAHQSLSVPDSWETISIKQLIGA
jgi:hypothetical protein